MDTIVWLAAANVVFWIGLGAYLAFLALEQRGISARLTRWEALHPEDKLQGSKE
ncbi:MAG: CcmD family protein [Desulfovibrio sp.]|jgi:CcmD family protein|nr:CcmD family protein [Desulfovibrio sp.]